MLKSATPISAYLNYNKLNYPLLSPVPLNLSQLYKPLLLSHPQYRYLKDKLDNYTKKIPKSSTPIDDYEIRTYEKLYQLLYDLSSINNEPLLTHQLQQIKNWLEEQEKIIKSRVKQGLERFNVTKESRRAMSLIDKLQTNRMSPERKLNIPSEIIEEALMPYIRKWRTYHMEGDLPAERLKAYERKQVQIEEPSKSLASEKKYAILNPNTSYLLNSELETSRGDKDRQAQTPTQYDQNASMGNETGRFLEQQQPHEDIVLPDEIPMFGQQIDEEESRQENDQNDLIPSTKLYLSATKKPSNPTLRKGKNISNNNPHNIIPYETKQQIISQTRLQLKFDRSRKNELITKQQDNEMINHMQKFMKNRSSSFQQEQKKLQLKTSIPTFTLFKQEESIQDHKLSDNLQKRYGLSQAQTARPRIEIDLRLSLPKVSTTGRNSVNFERTVEKPALDILKKRFSEVLQLPSDNEHEHEPLDESQKSLVQYTSQKKIFSNFIEQNNKKSYRQEQLNQLESLRDRLNGNRVNMNIQTLINGLCLPQENHLNIHEIPQKKLLHNEFIAEAKKIKRKKK